MRGFMMMVGLAMIGGRFLLAAEPEVTIAKAEGKDQFDVTIGGKLFTSYCYGEKFPDKPIFYPVLSPKGTPVNRSFPVGPKVEGEATDHPHQQSLWFTYGEVNGVDYWNLQKSGRRIAHRDAAVEGNKLKATLDWIDPKGVKILEQKWVVAFGGAEGVRWMDHDITLTAEDSDVVIGDSKEGAFGMRLARTLEEKGGTGRYINAEGLEAMAGVWGKASPWVALRGMVKGEKGDEPVTLAIFSHPQSFQHPPRWHARDYGLFAVNPFARKGYDAKAEPMETKLKKGESLKLRYRVAIYDGNAEKARMDKDYSSFGAAQ